MKIREGVGQTVFLQSRGPRGPAVSPTSVGPVSLSPLPPVPLPSIPLPSIQDDLDLGRGEDFPLQMVTKVRTVLGNDEERVAH